MLQKNIPLKKHSSYKIGGPAAYFYEFKSKEDLIAALLEWQHIDGDLDKILILGKGTNILFNDSGFDGLVLENNIASIKREGDLVMAGAGSLVSDLVKFCTESSLSGFEWAGGLPGTVGGAIRGNAGAYKGETKDNIEKVESIDINTHKVAIRKRRECAFGYRQSVFKNGEGRKEVILSATFKLKKGNQEEIRKSTQEKIDHRIDRHPLNYPSIGSTFKNIPLGEVPKKVTDEFKDHIKYDPFPVLPVAKLIIGAGLMGRSIGGAKISDKHPNFIVNVNNAKASDVMELIDLIKKTIKEKYNVSLSLEITFV